MALCKRSGGSLIVLNNNTVKHWRLYLSLTLSLKDMAIQNPVVLMNQFIPGQTMTTLQFIYQTFNYTGSLIGNSCQDSWLEIC